MGVCASKKEGVWGRKGCILLEEGDDVTGDDSSRRSLGVILEAMMVLSQQEGEEERLGGQLEEESTCSTPTPGVGESTWWWCTATSPAFDSQYGGATAPPPACGGASASGVPLPPPPPPPPSTKPSRFSTLINSRSGPAAAQSAANMIPQVPRRKKPVELPVFRAEAYFSNGDMSAATEADSAIARASSSSSLSLSSSFSSSSCSSSSSSSSSSLSFSASSSSSALTSSPPSVSKGCGWKCAGQSAAQTERRAIEIRSRKGGSRRSSMEKQKSTTSSRNSSNSNMDQVWTKKAPSQSEHPGFTFSPVSDSDFPPEGGDSPPTCWYPTSSNCSPNSSSKHSPRVRPRNDAFGSPFSISSHDELPLKSPLHNEGDFPDWWSDSSSDLFELDIVALQQRHPYPSS